METGLPVTFDDYCAQAQSNLSFIETLTESTKRFFDWTVTGCFYVAVQLTSAHYMARSGKFFRSHADTNRLLNPENPGSDIAWSEEAYLSYTRLEQLSRQARYLRTSMGTKASPITPQDVASALSALQTILDYFEGQHPAASFAPITVAGIAALPDLSRFVTA